MEIIISVEYLHSDILFVTKHFGPNILWGRGFEKFRNPPLFRRCVTLALWGAGARPTLGYSSDGRSDIYSSTMALVLLAASSCCSWLVWFYNFYFVGLCDPFLVVVQWLSCGGTKFWGLRIFLLGKCCVSLWFFWWPLLCVTHNSPNDVNRHVQRLTNSFLLNKDTTPIAEICMAIVMCTSRPSVGKFPKTPGLSFAQRHLEPASKSSRKSRKIDPVAPKLWRKMFHCHSVRRRDTSLYAVIGKKFSFPQKTYAIDWCWFTVDFREEEGYQFFSMFLQRLVAAWSIWRLSEERVSLC